METLISAVAGDLVSRFISFLAQNCRNHTRDDGDDSRRLERVLLRMHTVVEEAEGRCIRNRGMLLQMKMLVEDMYAGYYMLDRLKLQSSSIEEDRVEGELRVRQSQPCSGMYTFKAAKRLAFGSAATEHTTPKLKDVLESLETKIQDMREFVMLLGNCPRLSRQPYSTYLFMDRCMFGRHTEKQQLISFLLSNGAHDCCPCLGILPIIGPHRVGKKTLVQHACKDERVRSCFSGTFFFKGDYINNIEFTEKFKIDSGRKYLFVVEFSADVDEAAWTNFKSYLQKVAGAESKIVLIGLTLEVAKLGTAPPIWMKSLSQEEYWYYFKALAFGAMDPDEHPRLASLGMQLAAEMKGSFLGANILGEMLRANPDAQFWRSILSSIRELVQEHLVSFGVHPEDLLERNIPVDFANVVFVGAPGQRCLVYDLREAGTEQEELPLLTSREVLMGGKVPADDRFDVLVWKSRIPPYSNFVATFEKQKPQRVVGKKSRLALREASA